MMSDPYLELDLGKGQKRVFKSLKLLYLLNTCMIKEKILHNIRQFKEKNGEMIPDYEFVSLTFESSRKKCSFIATLLND